MIIGLFKPNLISPFPLFHSVPFPTEIIKPGMTSLHDGVNYEHTALKLDKKGPDGGAAVKGDSI